MLKVLGRLARELNWSRQRWSSATDRAFHEELYRHDDYEPFSLEYPGYTTIRRFADLVAPSLPESGSVVDLGCGPGEITCELAARRPDLSFIGVDHSEAAIGKARSNIARRGIANIRFDCRNVEEFQPPEAVELVTLFDAFHHLIDPQTFVRRLGLSVKRWALVEPRGSWAGTWQKDLDFDWLALDLDKIRAHVAALCDEPESSSAAVAVAPLHPEQAGTAVERRYTLDDFQRFFDGYALDIRGTVAGLEAYPAGSHQTGGLREQFGELRYQLYRDIDEWLLKRNLDLHAKHWLIVAERGGKTRHVDLRLRPGGAVEASTIAGPFDVRYGAYRGPREGSPGERCVGSIALTNEGWGAWSSERPGGVFTSYHWLDAKGHIVAFDGERTALPRPIAAGETCEVAINFVMPSGAGEYQLAIDLVREGVTWFSQAGRPWLAIGIRVAVR